MTTKRNQTEIRAWRNPVSLFRRCVCRGGHRKPSFLWLLVLLGLAAAAHGHAEGFLRAQGQVIVDGKGQPVVLRGMGLGGWMLQEGYMLQLPNLGQQHVIRREIEKLVGPERTNAFYAAWLANHTTRADIEAMASWGMNSIRLPMHFNLFTLAVEDEPVAGEQTWLDTGFELVDQLLEWAAANRMYLILDLHAAPGGQGNDLAIADRDPTKASLWESQANQDKTIALWRKLDGRYRDQPWIGAYNLINEPNWGFSDQDDRHGCAEADNAPLWRLQQAITRAIRQVDPRHMIVIEGNCWGNNYRGMDTLWDDNLAISFHKYWNHNTPESIEGMLRLREQHNAPLWLGESGENSNTWFTDAIALVEGEGIGWAFWPLKKLGFNNPLEIRPNEGYRQLVAYWQGQADRPDPDIAWQALMQLAREDIRFDNNRVRIDVIDAMMRQPRDSTTRPFRQHRLDRAGVEVAAVDYDLGRLGHAWHDAVAGNYHVSTGTERVLWNRGRTYRNDGVDIGFDTISQRHYVSHIEAGEWWQYTISVATAGHYLVHVLAAAEGAGGTVDLVVDDRPAITAEIPVTGGETRWGLVRVGELALAAGDNRIRVQARQGGFNFAALRLRPTTAAAATYGADAMRSTDIGKNGWQLVWRDEFDGERIDRSKWQLEANCWGGGNREQQCYTARHDDHPRANAFVRDGLLHIVARKERFSGPDSPEGNGRGKATLPYTSARLRTKHRQEWTFGRFEARVKLPRGQGTWPAVWMLPTDSPYGGWASSGEIDIVEAVNLGAASDAPGVSEGTPETRIHGTLHYGRRPPGNRYSGTAFTLPDGRNPADDFHVYAVEWEAGEIRWYVDDIHYATQRESGWYSQHDVNGELIDAAVGAPFDRHSTFHLLLNFAVGGNWAGQANATGIDASVFPQSMLVDYVRVFQCAVDPVSGRGCATLGEDPVLVVPDEDSRRPVLP